MSDPATVLAPACAAAMPIRQASSSADAAPGRAERTVTALLRRIAGDALELRTAQRAYLFGQAGAAARAGGPLPSLQIHDDAVFARVLRSGDIGLAEAYLDGQ